jgi:hypothetical protein
MSAKFCMAALAALTVAAIAPAPVLAHGYSDHGYGYAQSYYGHGYAGHYYGSAYPYHLRSYYPKYPFAMRRFFMTDPDPTVRFDLNRDGADRGRS